MKPQSKLLIAIGVTTVLLLALIVGGRFNNASAQGPWRGSNCASLHNHQSVLDLLKTNGDDLFQERQAGTSWLDIATRKGVSEQALTDAILLPMEQMHAWMAKNYTQSNAGQMTEWMRQQIAQDIRVTKYGTMTDMDVFGGAMMGGWNSDYGYGMMMHNWNGSSYGGMMNGELHTGATMGHEMMGWGMMGGWNYTPGVNATPLASTQKVDRNIALTTRNFQFDPMSVEVKTGETIMFKITNQDSFAHNAMSQDGKLAYTLLAPSQTTAIVWSAPSQGGSYTVICSWHPGMQFTIVVE